MSRPVSEDPAIGEGRDGWPFSYLQRVRFGDLDAMRHLNNVEFLRYFETARIAYITRLFPDHSPAGQREFGFIFAECHIAYRSPGHYDEDVITLRPARRGEALERQARVRDARR